MMQRLEKPDGEVVLSQVSPLLLADTITLLKQATADLVRSREEMATVWKDAESHFQRLHQLFHFKRDTTAVSIYHVTLKCEQQLHKAQIKDQSY